MGLIVAFIKKDFFLALLIDKNYPNVAGRVDPRQRISDLEII